MCVITFTCCCWCSIYFCFFSLNWLTITIKNFNAVIISLEKEKSNLTIKGDLIKSTYITSTMGVSYKIKLEKSF